MLVHVAYVVTPCAHAGRSISKPRTMDMLTKRRKIQQPRRLCRSKVQGHFAGVEHTNTNKFCSSFWTAGLRYTSHFNTSVTTLIRSL